MLDIVQDARKRILTKRFNKRQADSTFFNEEEGV